MVLLAALAVSRQLEKVTTPSTLGDFVHFDIRKLLSIAAFAAIGFLLALRRRRGLRDCAAVALIVGAYSALIEVAQWLHGEREGLYWNAVDVLCGLVGGYLGAWICAEGLTRRKDNL